MVDETSDDGRREDDWGASWGTESEPEPDSEPESEPEPELESKPDPELRANQPTTPDNRAETDRISIDLSRDSGSDTTQDVAHQSDSETETDEDDPYAPEPSSTPIEAGDPSLENALFVALGALIMILVLARVVSIMV
ncbi:cell-surface adhesin [Natrialba chahannaoensis JCM 10990]|uniref:Cell-surface adhesin n=1 Tax=Natrialba chahannaoensis JCM 10990 TaxID=1227492 RepID=M0A728_9EURY|nr:hypothetical protein [Natrialba chahannaoensis]ELY94359.1 cell-surface adhesin [Natrialba chahannaoensis JCM 10990]